MVILLGFSLPEFLFILAIIIMVIGPKEFIRRCYILGRWAEKLIRSLRE
jgi:Sec-independent protein translocase protein TatA